MKLYLLSVFLLLVPLGEFLLIFFEKISIFIAR